MVPVLKDTSFPTWFIGSYKLVCRFHFEHIAGSLGGDYKRYYFRGYIDLHPFPAISVRARCGKAAC